MGLDNSLFWSLGELAECAVIFLHFEGSFSPGIKQRQTGSSQVLRFEHRVSGQISPAAP